LTLLGLAAGVVPAGAQSGTAVAPTDEARIPSSGPSTYIWNGEDSSVAEFPFIIAGLRAGGSRPVGQSCSGAVVAARKILTAAHCKDTVGEKSFLYGLDDLQAGGGTRLEVESYVKHPRYVNFDQGYDVAVVTTKQDIPVPGGKYAAYATSADTGLNAPGKVGVGVGYGKKDHDDNSRDVTVDKADFPIREPRNCSGVGAGFREETMICAGFPDGNPTILPGDSGGPLIVDGKVVGVASWSRSDFRWYGVWGRLNNDMGDWVRQQVQGGEPEPGEAPKVALSPTSGSARPGFLTSVKVTVNGGTGGSTVTASGQGLPFNPTISPGNVSSGGTATMQVFAPFQRGSYPITVTATDSAGRSGSAVYTLNVN